MKVCRNCRTLNNDIAEFCENCGDTLGQGGATGNTVSRVQLYVGSAELDRLVIGGTASLGQTNAAQQLHAGVEVPVDEVTYSALNGPLGLTPKTQPEWDQ